ncbi:hypothetical protein KP509_18G018500 [Ceratopteris richardii]|uniref:DM2 domain-containing protein n=1 Tax=Ceratopteris richardii TaxID=49495 RepID=A0A8T2SSD6_CERRI|nr:hypothetical protein KP509_18G018500 [Ceratopteris richardii]
MQSSSSLSSLAGELLRKAASSIRLDLPSASCRRFSAKVKGKKAEAEGQLNPNSKPKSKSESEKVKPRLSGSALITYRVSASLAPVLQTSETTRPDALKRIWAYIKAHKLQSDTEKTRIMCDPALKKAFGQDDLKVNEVLKYLNPHLSRKV